MLFIFGPGEHSSLNVALSLTMPRLLPSACKSYHYTSPNCHSSPLDSAMPNFCFHTGKQLLAILDILLSWMCLPLSPHAPLGS